MFDEWDHFKGDFKGKKADKIPIRSGYSRLREAIEQHMIDSMIYGIGAIHVDVDGNVKPVKSRELKGYFNDVGEFFPTGSPLEHPDPCPETEPFVSIRECEHVPIDVGFNRVKLVCRKCDKDL